MLRITAGRLFVTALLVAGGLSGLCAFGASQLRAERAPAWQAQAQGTPQAPTFRLNVEAVEVDAVVTDRDGNFVRGLTRDDFQVLEDGKPQTVADFSLVDIPVDRPVRSIATPAAPPIEPDVRTNEHAFEGRVYVMVIDDLHIQFQRTIVAKTAARRFINERLGANDLMAIVHTMGGGNQDFTSNKRLLLASVDHTSGRKLPPVTQGKAAQAALESDLRRDATGSDQDDDERLARAQQALKALHDAAQWFANVRGRRKAILFLSEGVDFDTRNWANPDVSNNAHVVAALMRETIAAAAKGNASIYGIDPTGLRDVAADLTGAPSNIDLSSGAAEGAIADRINAQESLRDISDLTGGFAVVNANDPTPAFERIVRDNSSYYALAYYPPNAKVGAIHRIDVKVDRPGLSVRARQGYVTPAANAAVTRAAAAKDPLMTPPIVEALNSPVPADGLGVSAFAAPFKGTSPNASVLVGVEFRGRELRPRPGDRLTVSIVAVDQTGKTRGGKTDAVPLNLSPDQQARVGQSGLRLLSRVDLPPGNYQLRIAAQDARSKAVGSVLYDLEVPDFTKPALAMSGIALTSASTYVVTTVRPDEMLKAVLPAPPVTARTFPQNDVVALFAEVYDNRASTPHKVDVTTTVTALDGKVFYTAGETRDASEIHGARGGYGYSTRIPLQSIPAGDYLLGVSAVSRLGNEPPVERQVPITITAARPVPAPSQR